MAKNEELDLLLKKADVEILGLTKDDAIMELVCEKIQEKLSSVIEIDDDVLVTVDSSVSVIHTLSRICEIHKETISDLQETIEILKAPSTGSSMGMAQRLERELARNRRLREICEDQRRMSSELIEGLNDEIRELTSDLETSQFVAKKLGKEVLSVREENGALHDELEKLREARSDAEKGAGRLMSDRSRP
jgi:chromosome segregation ATPase